MAYRAAVVGGSGYTGAELLRLLAGHPEIEVVHATAATHAGARLADVYPSLASAYPRLEYVAATPRDLSGLDIAFVALPHGESQRLMREIVAAVPHVVDLGADFRLPAGEYRRWYGEDHTASELLDAFSFGLPELFREDVHRRPHVASPGCYPTVAALALAPLVSGGLVDSTDLVVDAMSGVSGAGRSLRVTSHFSEVDEAVLAYGLLTHRHTAEMELALRRAGETDVEVLFTPHLAPMVRGIHATCHARPVVDGLSTETLLATYHEFYADEPFVFVDDEPSPTKSATGGNACHLTVRFDDRTGRVLALGVIDNLVKGASGQAVQNANLLLGLPETTALSALGLWP